MNITPEPTTDTWSDNAQAAAWADHMANLQRILAKALLLSGSSRPGVICSVVLNRLNQSLSLLVPNMPPAEFAALNTTMTGCIKLAEHLSTNMPETSYLK